jgi:hypothetical protein
LMVKLLHCTGQCASPVAYSCRTVAAPSSGRASPSCERRFRDSARCRAGRGTRKQPAQLAPLDDTNERGTLVRATRHLFKSLRLVRHQSAAALAVHPLPDRISHRVVPRPERKQGRNQRGPRMEEASRPIPVAWDCLALWWTAWTSHRIRALRSQPRQAVRTDQNTRSASGTTH